jgi:SNF2 family DNA or RNA helicase
MSLQRAVLVRLAQMTDLHARARAAAARTHGGLLLPDALPSAPLFPAAAAASSGNSTTHYAQVFSELRTHPRVLAAAAATAEAEEDALLDRVTAAAAAADEGAAAAPPTPVPTTTTQKPIAAGVLRFHAEAREAMARARLRALRSNDMAGYLALLRGARDGRLREVFAESERVMRHLLAGLPASATAARPGETEEEEGGAMAAWERLAGRILEQCGDGGARQPAGLGGGNGGDGAEEQLRLRAYQLDGMKWMVGLKRLGLNGILADESGFLVFCRALAARARQRLLLSVLSLTLPNPPPSSSTKQSKTVGLGKTIQMLAAICSDIEAHKAAMEAWAKGRRAAATAAAAAAAAAATATTTTTTTTPAPPPPPPPPPAPRPPPRRPALILCPASVLPNWAAEARRWAPGLRVLEYSGPAAHRDALWESAFQGGGGRRASSSSSAAASAKFDALLVSYETLMSRRDCPRLCSISYGWLVVDEGHRLKNRNCRLASLLRAFRAPCRLLLTGTPLQMDLRELWSLLDFLMPGAFGSSEDFDAWFSAPLRALKEAAGDEAGAEAGGGAAAATTTTTTTTEAALLSEEEYVLVASRLHRVLRPFVLRRVKEAVVGELPRKSEHGFACGASPYEAALCALVRLAAASNGSSTTASAAAAAVAAAAASAEKDDGHEQEQQEQQQEDNNNPAAARPRRPLLSFSEAAMAALRASPLAQIPPAGALKAYNNPLMEVRKACNHPFLARLHSSAVEGGGGAGEEDDGLGNSPSQPPPLVRMSGKFEVLDRLIARLAAATDPLPAESNEEAEEGDWKHRVLLFSTMTTQLDLAAAVLERRGLPYLRLDGNTATSQRGELAAQFGVAAAAAASSSAATNAARRPFAFLLSVRAGGVGLNLQAADTVLFLDSDPNPQADLQAQARAHRMGQQKEVRVYRLFSAADGCEQAVARRCEGRRRMAAAAVDAGRFDGRGGAESEAERRGVLIDVLRGEPGAGAGGVGVGTAATLPPPPLLLGAEAEGSGSSPPPPVLSVLEAVAGYAARAAEAAELAGLGGPTDDELNEAVARDAEELAMLQRRFPPAAAVAPPATAAAQPLLLRGGRLASAAECARLIRRACAASLAPKRFEESDLSLYGRGMRRALQASSAASAAAQALRASQATGKRKGRKAEAETAAAAALLELDAGGGRETTEPPAATEEEEQTQEVEEQQEPKRARCDK